jgi:2,4-dienoyl-CoA reductase-like NADH-dependent reductase (Old Yellow Enzyme family)
MKCATSQQELSAMLKKLETTLPMVEDLAVLAKPVQLGRWVSPNRFVALPMEGCDTKPNGAPGPLTYRRYERMAAGGAGILWLEACAVVPEGRSNPHAFYLTEENRDAHREFLSHVRHAARDHADQDILCILQLTHSGRYCRPTGVLQPMMVRHCPELDEAEGLSADHPLLEDAYLDTLQEEFVRTASLAEQAGYDGVDVKSCHGYLLSSLLGAHKRPGRYGGSYENRTRFLKQTIARIRQELPNLLVTTRLNIFDGISAEYAFGVSSNDPHTPDLSEPIRLVRELSEMDLPLLSVSMGFPRYDGHFGRPAADGKQEHPLLGIARFCDLTSQIQQAVPQMAVVNAALAWLGNHIPTVAAGLVQRGDAQLIGQGRNSLAYPDSVRDILTGTFDPRKSCVACSACSRLLRDKRPVGCIIRDREVYPAT